MKPLTEKQKLFRETYMLQGMTPVEFDQRFIELETETSPEEVEHFLEVLYKEEALGICLYPPPVITKENQHLFQREVDDSWMYD